jgi:CubicO group peptidase (beta-lactamase class C family)
MRALSILAIAHMLAATPAALAGQSAYAAAADTGRAVLEGIVARGEAPAVAAAVVIDGRVVWSGAAGFAHLTERAAATDDTRFGIGSISKTVTMAAVMRLVDRGAIDLDAPVERYLPDFPHAGAGITLRLLAAHQSGLADAFATEHYQTARHFPTLDEAYRSIRHERREAPAGTRFQYATGLYTIVGRAIEQVTGMSYLAAVRTLVFEPLGLTTFDANDRMRTIPDLAGFYVEGESRFVDAPFFDPSHKLPGAGLVATARDVARLGAALLSDSFLSERARAEMFRPVPLRDGTPTEYALGLRVREFDGHRVLHLPGGGLGISAWLFIHPDHDMAIAILSNVPTGPVGGATHARIARAFRPRPLPE